MLISIVTTYWWPTITIYYYLKVAIANRCIRCPTNEKDCQNPAPLVTKPKPFDSFFTTEEGALPMFLPSLLVESQWPQTINADFGWSNLELG